MSSHNQLSLFSTILLFFLLASTLSAEKCHPDDKKTLFKIKKSFNNVDKFGTWTHDSDCCEWYLVSCDETNHRIITLSVNRDDGVAGHLPDAVGDLPYLEQLIFTDLPKLTGPIPHTISKLKNLKVLWLSHTNLTGSIPDFFSRLTKLTYINLSVNKLTGPIPPSLSSLHKLGALFLESNQLKGTIPASFGGFKNNRNFYLKLARNQLYGPLPKSFGAVNFEVLDLSRNMLTGDASMLFGTNKGLEVLDISRNKFSFDLSKVRFPKGLDNIEMSHNMIYGSIPPTLAQQPHIQFFNISYNRLCGKIPSSKELKHIDKYSYAHNKCLCGSPLPPCKK